MFKTYLKKFVCRHSFTVLSEEVFLLFSEKTLSELRKFLDIGSETKLKLSKSRLQSYFVQNYSWQSLLKAEDIQKMDEKCSGLYELSIYRNFGDNDTFSFKKIKYPIKFKINLED